MTAVRHLKTRAAAAAMVCLSLSGCLSGGHAPFSKLLPAGMSSQALADDPEFRKEVEKDPFPSGPLTAEDQSK